MSYIYLIADNSANVNAVIKACNDFYWVWLDEKEETERSPYSISFEGSDPETRIWYYEEHKDVFEARYFIIAGPEADKTAEQIRGRFDILSREQLIERFQEAVDPYERGSAIFQLGVGCTGQAFDRRVFETFGKALKDTMVGVRIAVLYGMNWTCWEENISLAKEARQDSDDDVARIAGTFVEANAFQKVSNAFLKLYPVDETLGQTEYAPYFTEFNTLLDGFLTEFPNASSDSIAREAAYQFGISMEEAQEQVELARTKH